MKRLIVLLLFFIAFLGYSGAIFAQTDSLIIKTPDGKEILADSDNAMAASGAWNIKKAGAAQGYIFSVEPGKKKSLPATEKTFTGVFSSHNEVKQTEIGDSKGLADSYSSGDPDFATAFPDIASEFDKETIAWITKEADFYHDPFLDCGSHSYRLWVKDIAPLAGLEPCNGCFHLTNHAPEFIKNECGGLDLATAGALLDNEAFLKWVEEHLPIKKAVFLTSQKMLIYPKQEMSEKGLTDLAHETAMAYRRHCWKVIEVMAKKTELDLESVSSY